VLSLQVSLVIAAILAVFLLRARRNFRALPLIHPLPASETPPDCMVVIPARNEEARIARAIGSLPHDTVIVVDDHSDDATVEAARKAGAGVLPAPKLSPGMPGKSNACLAGARVLTSRWILFADADTWYERGFLVSAVAAAEAGPLDFLSIYLRPEYRGVSGHILGPIAVALYFCGANPRRDPAALFNGQCLLVRREAYEFIGGHAAVLTNLFEDLKLVALAQRHRLKFAVVRTDLGQVRIHPGDFERNAHRFTEVSPRIGILILLAALFCALWLAALTWLLIERQWVAAAACGLVPLLLLLQWYRGLRVLFAPLGMFGMLPILARGFVAAVTGRAVEWKGRVI
jgi:glycosyltransferase involved in cell wall biosynthesis